MKTRPKTIGSSDAMRIVRGDWQNLWKEKMGHKEPDDLSDNFQVQLGLLTEPMHLEWIKSHEIDLSEMKIAYVSGGSDGETPVYDPNAWTFQGQDTISFAHTTPDAVVEMDPGTGIGNPVEVKHTHGRNSLWDAVEYYMPQLQHHMMVMDADRLWFSVIIGNQDPSGMWVERDDKYILELYDHELKFWSYIEQNIEPPALEPRATEIAPPAQVAKVDMTYNNAWAATAGKLIDTKAAAKDHDRYKTELKDLMPSDARVATGHGVKIARDKRGSMRITFDD